MMPTVMMDGRYLGPRPSGVGRYCVELVTASAGLEPDWRWRFVVRRPGEEGRLPADEIVVFDHQEYGPATSFLLGRRLGARPADLFHAPFHVLPAGLECPTVVTMHDTFNFIQPKTSNRRFPISWLEWGYFLLAIPESLRRADRIVCVSQTTADDLVRRVPGCRDKIRVIHHGVAKTFRVLGDSVDVGERCRRLVGDGPFILCIGGISPNKNHRRMLDAYARAFGGDRQAPRLVTVSRFGDPEPLVRRARELGFGDRHVSIRSPDDDAVVALYNGAEALFFCSIVEGFGFPVLEAMTCGCPVVTSNVSCLPEIAGGAALSCNPYDVDDMASALRRVVREPGLRDELKGRGIEWAAEFTWPKAARLHLDLYRELLA